MTKADTLRKELVSINKEDVMEKIANSIRRQGYFSMAECDHTSLQNGFFTITDYKRVLDWAREEGFRIETHTSYYGQRWHAITL